MKSNHTSTNILPLLGYMLAIMLLLVLPLLAFADGSGAIAPEERLTPKELRSAETIVQHERPGALLPFPTYQTDDTPRPKFWNGYGVDPGNINKNGSRLNWYRYYSPDTECYEGYSDVWEGTDHCKQEGEEESRQSTAIPEPSGITLLGMLIGFVWLMVRRRA
jgi:hypothetical protein